MTTQYQGNGEHKIFIGERELILSQDEINRIQAWDFINQKDISAEIEDLEDELDKIQSSTSDIYDELVEVINGIDNLLEDDEINYGGLLIQREKISKINQKLGEI